MMEEPSTQRAEPITKPPTRWRNRWLARMPMQCSRCLEVYEADSEVVGCLSFATEGAARQSAANSLSAGATGPTVVHYLGAVPVEDEE